MYAVHLIKTGLEAQTFLRV